MWAETGNGWPTSRSYLISIHSARVGGDKVDGRIDLDAVISIHSARVGGDYIAENQENDLPISIHSARVGGDSKRNHFFVS